MKERVAGARGQSADRNYRRPYERGQLTRVVLEGVEGAESSEKRRLAGGISGFWWPLGDGFGSFRRKWGIWVWYDDCKSTKCSRSSREVKSLTYGCLEPERFTGKGCRGSHLEESPPTKQRSSGASAPSDHLEASDWLLGARAIFRGGEMAQRLSGDLAVTDGYQATLLGEVVVNICAPLFCCTSLA